MSFDLQVATREAKRQNTAYRPHGIRCLAKVCRARNDVDLSGSVFAIVEPVLREALARRSESVDADQASRKDDEV